LMTHCSAAARPARTSRRRRLRESPNAPPGRGRAVGDPRGHGKSPGGGASHSTRCARGAGPDTSRSRDTPRPPARTKVVLTPAPASKRPRLFSGRHAPSGLKENARCFNVPNRISMEGSQP
jgi:hypothetical protein